MSQPWFSSSTAARRIGMFAGAALLMGLNLWVGSGWGGRADLAPRAYAADDPLLEEPSPREMKTDGGDDPLLSPSPPAAKSADDDPLLGAGEDASTSPPGPGQSGKNTSATSATEKDKSSDAAADPARIHAELFVEQRYPSARACATCHPNHYRQWSASQHAYAQLSPIFNAFHGRVLELTGGTSGDFCIRCHTPVGMALEEPIFTANANRHAVSREGITCIVCHRVSASYGKVSGRRGITPGGITKPIQGPTGRDRVIRKLIEEGEATADGEGFGRQIHGEVRRFFQLVQPAFCATCHDVTLPNGFRLEEAFSDYKASPAARLGVSCQDCHMGKDQGDYTGDDRTNYAFGPAARVGGEWTEPRKLTNHMIVGPDYSVIHPALFPQSRKAIREQHEKNDPAAEGLATIDQWLRFDHEAGWGNEAFERKVFEHPQRYVFPTRWSSADDRYAARRIIERNQKLMSVANWARLDLLRDGYKLGKIEVHRSEANGLRFRVRVSNGTSGHSVPTGFDGERLVWLHVSVADAAGRAVMESGDLDPNGDLRDRHSLYVEAGEAPVDEQLFTLTGEFLTRNARGGERERVVPINRSQGPLPYVRPETRSSVLLGHPGGARKQRRGIPPGGHRWAEYRVDPDAMTAGGPYTISVELKAGMVPVHLIHAIRSVGFDYQMTPRELADAVVAGHQVLWTRRTRVE